jgi:hypothetical protein
LELNGTRELLVHVDANLLGENKNIVNKNAEALLDSTEKSK